MANHKSASKRARQTEKRTIRNRNVRSRTRSAVKAFREALASGDAAKAQEFLGLATRALNKAASKGVVHKRNAARGVSRLTKAFQKLSTAA